MNQQHIVLLHEGWSVMEQGITKLINILEERDQTQFNSEEYMILYTNIYNMCTQNPPNDFSQELYDNYKTTFDEYLNSTVAPSLVERHDEFMLMEFVKRWANHRVMVRWLSRFFHYIDRFFTVRKLIPALKEVGFTCFRDLVYQVIKSNAKDAVIALIDQEREGEQIDRALLKSVLDIFVEIGMGNMDCYKNDFEAYFLIDTSEYYSRKASNWIIVDSCSDYMWKVEECLKKEVERVSHYLHSRSETKLVKIVQNELLVAYSNQLLEHSGGRTLLRDDKFKDISRMYRLFHKIPNGLESIASMFKQHVISEGMVLVQQAEDSAVKKAENAGGAQEQSFVRNVIKLHDKYFAYVTGCFFNKTLFHKALKEAFQVFCNKTIAGASSAELLSLYCDSTLKKGGYDRHSDEAIEETIDKVVGLLAYINDKDLFAEFHRKKLSRRLLFDKSGNEDHERLILTKLKQQCGAQFTSKMEGMITDLTLAKEYQSKFQDYLRTSQTALGMNLSATVLTTGFWPSYKTSDLILPADMAKCVESFKEFYQTKTKHRKLTWIYSLGTCHLNGKFEQKNIEMVMTTYQATILLLFNGESKLSYSDIKSQTNLSDEDLVRLLHSLSCAKYNILIKEPLSRSVSSNDFFVFNSKFTDKMKRIRIPLPPADERRKVAEVVEKDRRFAIDASVVRIMKSRKVLEYQQLVMECVQQLSRMFRPDIKDIKKRIEDLITRDYLERENADPNLFRYIA